MHTAVGHKSFKTVVLALLKLMICSRAARGIVALAIIVMSSAAAFEEGVTLIDTRGSVLFLREHLQGAVRLSPLSEALLGCCRAGSRIEVYGEPVPWAFAPAVLRLRAEKPSLNVVDLGTFPPWPSNSTTESGPGSGTIRCALSESAASSGCGISAKYTDDDDDDRDYITIEQTLIRLAGAVLFVVCAFLCSKYFSKRWRSRKHKVATVELVQIGVEDEDSERTRDSLPNASPIRITSIPIAIVEPAG